MKTTVTVDDALLKRAEELTGISDAASLASGRCAR